MALPKLVTPEFKTTIPSTGQEIVYRPFLVKEEKLLYMALEANDERDAFDAIRNILKSCILNDVDVDQFTTYDLEFLFLKLRSKSVGETVSVGIRHRDSECTHVTNVDVDLESIEIVRDERHENTLVLTDSGIGIKLKDPVAVGLTKLKTGEDDVSTILKAIYECAECIFDSEEVYNDFTYEEFLTWADTMNHTHLEKILKFFETLPKLSHTVKYKCEACGETEEVKIEGLQNFFT